MTDEQVYLMLKRIKTAEPDFMEYLKELSHDNYNKWLQSGSGLNDICKGYAICVDKLIASFEQCDKEQIQTPANEQAFY
jgi:hypothetical protein